MSFRDDFKVWKFKRQIKKGKLTLTPTGECFLNYCRLIDSGNWTEKDRIEEYERKIEEGIKNINEAMGSETYDRELFVAHNILILERMGRES